MIQKSEVTRQGPLVAVGSAGGITSGVTRHDHPAGTPGGGVVSQWGHQRGSPGGITRQGPLVAVWSAGGVTSGGHPAGSSSRDPWWRCGQLVGLPAGAGRDPWWWCGQPAGSPAGSPSGITRQGPLVAVWSASGVTCTCTRGGHPAGSPGSDSWWRWGQPAGSPAGVTRRDHPAGTQLTHVCCIQIVSLISPDLYKSHDTYAYNVVMSHDPHHSPAG